MLWSSYPSFNIP
ncbi:hypothetical protein MXB_4248 [Myxobolus squamalis]|nr:hypothetical protein MXB_4248 [Myxobolus squamalis]